MIIEYLEETFPTTALMPRDPYRRALARLWMKKIDDYVHAACGALTFAIAFRPVLLRKTSEELEARFAAIPDLHTRERHRSSVMLGLDAPQSTIALQNYDKFIGEMEQTLSQSQYLAGDTIRSDPTCEPHDNIGPRQYPIVGKTACYGVV